MFVIPELSQLLEAKLPRDPAEVIGEERRFNETRRPPAWYECFNEGSTSLVFILIDETSDLEKYR